MKERTSDLPPAKVIIMGDYGVGKTSLAKRLVGEGFQQRYEKTIGVDFKVSQLPIPIDHSEIDVEWVIWDLAGHWNFQDIRSDFFKGAKAGMFVYGIPRPKTLEALWRWGKRLKKALERPIPAILVGNKKDMRGEVDTCVPRETAEEYAKKLQNLLNTNFEIPYVETSAKNDEKVEHAFQSLVHLYKRVEASSNR